MENEVQPRYSRKTVKPFHPESSLMKFFNPIQDGLFRGCSKMREGVGGQKDLLTKICHTYLTIIKLGTVIEQKIENIYELRNF